jgi:hypothetical protein
MDAYDPQDDPRHHVPTTMYEIHADMRFNKGTAWRLSKECAMGYELLHSIGYMHRDIKSL